MYVTAETREAAGLLPSEKGSCPDRYQLGIRAAAWVQMPPGGSDVIGAGAGIAVAALELPARAARARVVPSGVRERVVDGGPLAVLHVRPAVDRRGRVLEPLRAARREPGRNRVVLVVRNVLTRGRTARPPGVRPAAGPSVPPGRLPLGAADAAVPPGRRRALVRRPPTRVGTTRSAGSIGGSWRAPGSLPGRRGRCAGRGSGLPADRGPAGSRAADLQASRPRAAGSALLLDDRVLLDLDLEVEQVPDGLFLDAVHHGAEHVVALALVLDQRVALAVTAQADALAQVVHLVQVLAPLAVEHGQHYAPLDLAHDLGAEFLLASLVGALGVGDHLLGDELAGEPGPVAARLLDDVVDGEGDRVQLAEGPPELVQVPLLRVALAGLAVDVPLDHLVDELADLLVQVGALEYLAALAVDDHALAVHHVVVLEHVLADLEVLLLDLGLGRPDGPGDDLGLDRDVRRDVQPLHDGADPRGVEHPHQVVLERQVEPALAGVALPSGPAAELVVDAARLVPLGAEHVQAARLDDLLVLLGHRALGLRHCLRPGHLVVFRGLDRRQAALVQLGVGDELGVAAQHDVGAAAGHVGGHGDRAPPAGLGDDRRLPLVVLGVQHLVRDAAPLEHPGHDLGLLHAGGADQDGLPGLVPFVDVLDARLEFGLRRLVDHVGLVVADHRLVGRDRDHAELVDRVELVGLGDGRTRHAGQLVVEAEVVLEGDGGEGLVLVLDRHPLLGLDGLVHALVVAPAVQDAAGELVHDQDLAVHHDVVLVLLVQLLRLDGVVQEADQGRVDGVVEVVDAEPVLDLLHPGLQDADGLLLLVDLVVAVAVLAAAKPGRDLGELLVPARALLGRAADDQRGPRLVDQDRVHLVDDRVEVAALHAVLELPGHVVAQVVEAELVVGAVGDVAPVLLAAGGRIRLGAEDHAHAQAEEAVHPAHPLGVALGQVVVDRDHVHAVPGDGVEVGREHAGERLALTGLHLGDVAQVQCRGPHQLDVEGSLAEGPLGRLADCGESLGEQVVQGFPVGVPLPELVGHGPELGITHRDEVVFDGVDLLADPLQLAQDPAFARAKDAIDDGWHCSSRSSAVFGG